MEIESEVGLNCVFELLEESPLRRLECESIAVHVDALRCASLKARCAVGIEHREKMDRECGKYASGRAVAARYPEIIQDIGNRHRGRRLVPVHLRPEENLCRSAAHR